MNSLTAKVVDDGYLRVSHLLVKEYGFVKAGVLTDLISKFDFYKSRGELFRKKWFFYRRENMEENWCIKADTQRKILGELKKSGLIDFERMGPLPLKNYYTVNDNNIKKLILSLQAKYKTK